VQRLLKIGEMSSSSSDSSNIEFRTKRREEQKEEDGARRCFGCIEEVRKPKARATSQLWARY
jgi:hypothetical protein